MIRVVLRAATLALVTLAACAVAPTQPTRHLTFLHLNDVYELGAADGKGGMARLKTVVDGVRREKPPAILTIGGDFMSPSVMSSVFQGRQMIEAFNLLGVTYVTPGNHEFDFGAGPLDQRVAESRFKWVSSNILRDGDPYPGMEPFVMQVINEIPVGFFGIITPAVEEIGKAPYSAGFLSPSATAKKMVNTLKSRGAKVIVALTHMTIEEDRQLARDVSGINLILGGHDHGLILEVINGVTILKSGPNTGYLGRVDVTVDQEGVHNSARHIPIEPEISADTVMDELILKYEAALDTRLAEVVGELGVALDATEKANRTGETNLGDLLTGVMRKRTGAQVALLNGGAIRSDRVVPEGPVTRRDIHSILPFSDKIVKVILTGVRLRLALEHGFARSPEPSGGYLQVSGASLTVDPSRPAGNRIVEVMINGEPLASNQRYSVAISDYLYDGGDGFTMFREGNVAINPMFAEDMAKAVSDTITSEGKIWPRAEGWVTLTKPISPEAAK